MKFSLALLAAAFGYPVQQPNWNNFLVPYLVAKRINWTPNFNWNAPSINFSPFKADDKTFLTETIVPAYMANRYQGTASEAMNWLYYMKKNHPMDLQMIERLIPTALLAAQAPNPEPIPPNYNRVDNYVPQGGFDLIPEGYQGASFQTMENWGNAEGFFDKSNARYPN